MGVAVGFSAILASLVYFKALYGPTSFLYINLAVYGPSLPTAIIQSRFDSVNDRSFGSRKSFLVRAIFYFTGSAAALTCIPLSSPDDFVLLMVLGLIVGTLSGLAYGSFYQLVSTIKSDGKLQATFAMGYQGAGVIVFLIQLLFHFTSDVVSDPDLWYFFTAAGLVEMVSLSAYVYLHCKSEALANAFLLHDRSVAMRPVIHTQDTTIYSRMSFSIGEEGRQSILNSLVVDNDPIVTERDTIGTVQSTTDQLSSVGAVVHNKEEEQEEEEGENKKHTEAEEQLSFKEVAHRIWPCMLALFFTIFSNLFVMAFYTFVPSSNGAELGQILFFVKLFSDMLGRPSTVLCPFVKTTRLLLIGTFLRFAAVPVFFIYTFTDIIPRNDWVFCICVGVFSYTAGYLNTVCYQLAPNMLQGNGAKIANVINTVFHAAIFMSLVGSFFVRYVVLADSIGE